MEDLPLNLTSLKDTFHTWINWLPPSVNRISWEKALGGNFRGKITWLQANVLNNCEIVFEKCKKMVAQTAPFQICNIVFIPSYSY